MIIDYNRNRKLNLERSVLLLLTHLKFENHPFSEISFIYVIWNWKADGIILITFVDENDKTSVTLTVRNSEIKKYSNVLCCPMRNICNDSRCR